jgi:hypothetical protein
MRKAGHVQNMTYKRDEKSRSRLKRDLKARTDFLDSASKKEYKKYRLVGMFINCHPTTHASKARLKRRKT